MAKVTKKRIPLRDLMEELQEFVDVVSGEAYGDTVVSGGIDPGAEGAIGFICRNRYAVIDIPTIDITVDRVRKVSAKERAAGNMNKTRKVEGHSTQFDLAAICAVFALIRPLKDRLRFILEKAPLTLGPGKHTADVMLNRAYAMWPLFLLGRNYRTQEVTPGDWKKAMALKAGDDAKERARLRAISQFPKAELHLVKHHNRAEALLLADFGRRHMTF